MYPIIFISAAEPCSKSSGHRCLAPPGIGTRVPVSIAGPDPQRSCTVEALDLRSCHDRECGQAGGDEVCEIVEARSGAAEITIRRLRVADHRIECVDGF